MRLRRLTIRKYRDLAGPVELEFGRGHVFLLGKNGTGKSTLLELIGRLLAFDLASLRDEPEGVDLEWVIETSPDTGDEADATIVNIFECKRPAISYKMESNLERAGQTLESEYWSIIIEVSIPTPKRRQRFTKTKQLSWTWQDAGEWPHDLAVDPLRIHWTSDAPPTINLGKSIQFKNNYLRGSSLDYSYLVYVTNEIILFLTDPTAINVTIQPNHLTALHWISNDRAATVFDESLICFGRIIGDQYIDAKYISSFSESHSERQFLPQAIDFEVEFLLAKETNNLSGSHTLSPWLSPLLNATRVEARPRLYQRDAKGQSTYRGFDLYVTWPDGSLHHHSQLSFGQKRLIAFAWYADVAPEAPLLTDELTNGMHAAWVRRIVEVLGDRQAIHALQNPLLLDAVGPGEPDEVRARFILCDVADDPRLWTWRNPTEAEAARIHAAWSTGFQHLSEILESEGLW